jgi:hypothetical protein
MPSGDTFGVSSQVNLNVAVGLLMTLIWVKVKRGQLQAAARGRLISNRRRVGSTAAAWSLVLHTEPRPAACVPRVLADVTVGQILQ